MPKTIDFVPETGSGIDFQPETPGLPVAQLDPLQKWQVANPNAGRMGPMGPETTEFTQSLATVPKDAAKALRGESNELTQALGTAPKYAAKALRVAGDALWGGSADAIEARIKHPTLDLPAAMALTEATRDPNEAPGNLAALSRGEPMPIDYQKASLPRSLQIAEGAMGGLVKSVPQLAATAALSAGGVPPPVAAGMVFGQTEEGFSPKQAVIAAALPVIGKWSGGLAETLATRLGVANETAANVINRLGGAGAATGLLTADQWNEIRKLPEDKQKQAWADAVENVAGMALLGVMDQGHSKPMDVAARALRRGTSQGQAPSVEFEAQMGGTPVSAAGRSLLPFPSMMAPRTVAEMLKVADLAEDHPPILPKQTPNQARSLFKPQVPEFGSEPARGMTAGQEEQIALQLQIQQVQKAGARSKAEIQKLFPEMNRQQAAQLRDAAWGEQTAGEQLTAKGPDATQERDEPGNILKQRPGNDESGPSAEAGSSSRVPPTGPEPPAQANGTPQTPVPVAGETVTLYSGKGGSGGAGQGGSWFTSNIEKARSYGPDVQAVEVPKEVADQAKAAAQKQGQGGDTYFLTREYSDQAKPIEAPTEKVIEIAQEDDPPQPPPVSPAANAFAKENGWTVKGAQSGAVSIPPPEMWKTLSEADKDKYRRLVEASGHQIEFTDRRTDSPTKGQTFYVKAEATPEEMQSAFDRKQKEFGTDKPAAPAAPVTAETTKPEPAKVGGRDWGLFAENVLDQLDAFHPARDSGHDYEMQDAAARFFEFARADKSGKPLDKLVSDFAKQDEASNAQISKLRKSVKSVLAQETEAPAPKATAAPVPKAAPAPVALAAPKPEVVAPTFKEGDKVMVGTAPMDREGTIAGPGPRGGFFVKTNLGEVFYELGDIRKQEAKPAEAPEPKPAKPVEKPAPSSTEGDTLAMRDPRIDQKLKDDYTKAKEDLATINQRLAEIDSEAKAIGEERSKGVSAERDQELEEKDKELAEEWSELKRQIVTKNSSDGPAVVAFNRAAYALDDARYEADVAPFRGKREVPGEQKITSADINAQRVNLLGQVKDAQAKAPTEGTEKITFKVPGDGEFTVFNTKDALKKFQEIVDKGRKGRHGSGSAFPKSVGADNGPGLPSGKASTLPKVSDPVATKKESLSEVLGKIVAPFISEDPERFVLNQAYSDGTQIIATDGRRMLRVVTDKAPGTPAEPVGINAKGKEVPLEGDYPNYNQILSGKSDLARGGAPTDQLWNVAVQASKLWDNPGEKEIPAVTLLINPDGSIAAKSTRVGVGEYEHNVQPGAKSLGNYNPEYIRDIAAAARRLGNERVDLYAHGDEGALEFRGKNSTALVMSLPPGETTGRETGFLPSKAEHSSMPTGLGPLKNPEGNIASGTIDAAGQKWSVDLAAGEFSIQHYLAGSGYAKGEWRDMGSMSLADYDKLSKGKTRADAIAKAAGAKPGEKIPEAVINALDEQMRRAVKERSERQAEGAARMEKQGFTGKLSESLDNAADAARKRLKSRGTTFGSGPLHELPNIGDYAIIGAAKLAKLGLRGADWAVDMVKEFGERIRPYLDQIHKLAREELDRQVTVQRHKETPVQELIAQATGAEAARPTAISQVIDTLQSNLQTVRALRDHFEGGPKVPRAEVKAADDWLEADANRIRESLVHYAKQSLPPDERGRFLAAITNATKRSPILTGDPEAMYRRAAEVAARIENRAEEVQKNSAVNQIKDQVAKALRSPTVDIGYKARILDVLRRVSFDRHLPATMEALKATREFINRMEAQGKDVAMPREILDNLEVLSKVPARELPLNVLRTIQANLERLEQLGRLKVKARQEVWEMEKDAQLAELAGEDTTPFDKRPEFSAQPGDLLPAGQKVRNWLSRQMDKAALADKALLPTDALFDLLGDAKGTYDGWLFRNVRGPIDLGFNGAQVMRDRLSEPVERLLKEHKMGEREAERIGVYAMAQQENGPARLVEMGVKPETIRQITESLTPAEKAVYLEMRKAMDSQLPQIQKLMHELYNIDVPGVENYFPMPRDWKRTERAPAELPQPKFGEPMTFDELGGWKEMFKDFFGARTSKTEQGMTLERLPGAITPVKLNAFDVFYQHINDVSYLLNTQRQIKQIGEMARGDLFAQKYGKTGQNLVLDWLDTVARQGRLGGFRRIPWLDELRRRTSAGVIGFRVASQFVHLSNVPLSIQRTGGIGFYQAGLRTALSQEGQAFLKEHFAETYARGGGEPALVEASESDLSVFGKTLIPKSVVRAGFAVARQIDRLNSQATVLGVYFNELAKKGIDPAGFASRPVDAQAQAKALVLSRRAVASPLPKDSPMALSRGALTRGNVSFGRSLLQFQNIFLDQWSNMRHDLWRAGIVEKNPKLAASMVLALTAMMIAESGIRDVTKETLEAVFNLPHKEGKHSPGEKAAVEVARRFPFGGQLTAQLLYGKTGVPLVDTALELPKAVHGMATAANARTADKATVRATTSALQLMGVPGASQVGELIQKAQ